MTILSRPDGPQPSPNLISSSPDLAAAPTPTSLSVPVPSGADVLPPEHFWLDPDPSAFIVRADHVVEALRAHLLMLPPRLAAGPLGCATAWNVSEFVRDGQPDRAWRLAARLMLAARAAGLPRFEGQVADDLAVSALLLAGEVHGCAFGLLEAACLLGRMSEAAVAGALRYPALPQSPNTLAHAVLVRRDLVLEAAARRMVVDGVSPGSSEALMWRAPLADAAPAPGPRR